METAVSWECAARKPGGLPEPIANLFRNSELGEAQLLFAVAEHKVSLRGTGGDSQCDVWALVKTGSGTVSLAVEAKALEPFGAGNEALSIWLKAGKSVRSAANRERRWEHLRENLPNLPEGAYDRVPYQILHRGGAAVIEARRFGLKHATILVQGFGCPDQSFAMYGQFCGAIGRKAEREKMSFIQLAEIRLGVGWVDCPFATDAEMASVI